MALSCSRPVSAALHLLGAADTLKKMDAEQSSLSADFAPISSRDNRSSCVPTETAGKFCDCSCSNHNLRSLRSPSCLHELDNVGNGNTVREIPWSRGICKVDQDEDIPLIVVNHPHCGLRGTLKEIHVGEFSCDVLLKNGTLLRGVEYEDACKLMYE